MLSLQYIAGFFDGEGHIRITKTKHKTLPNIYKYYLVIQFTNTHKEVMEKIHQVVGGSLTFNKGNHGLKPHWRVTLYTNKAYECIKILLPYLVVKKLEAECAIKFQESLRPYGSGGGLTEEELNFREECHLLIKSMHCRPRKQ